MIEFPLCKTCNLFKIPKDFKPDKQCRGGHKPSCRLCNLQRAWMRKYGTLDNFVRCSMRRLSPAPDHVLEERRQHERDLENVRYHKDLEQSRAKNRRKYAANPEAPRARSRQYYAENPEKCRAASQQQYVKDPALQRHYRREFTKRHPGYTTPHSALRRARLKAVPVIDKVIEVAVLYKRDKGICSLCLHKVDAKLKFPHPQSATVDHIIPLAQGGEHSLRNTTLAHYSCNSSKQDRVRTQQLRLFG
jgi:HNH endonuclease